MKPKVVEVVLDSGVKVHVKSLARYDRQSLQQAAIDRFPYPDKSQYEEELAEDVAVGGMKIPAERNEVYRQLVAEIEEQRQEFITTAMLDMCVTFPEFSDGKDGVIEHFADAIAKKRTYMTLPEDAWTATWKHGVLGSPSDEAYIAQIVRDDLPLREAEVSEAMRLFRPALSREATRLLDFTRLIAPRIQAKIQNKP